MPVVDTSWLVALFNPEDAHHGKAVEGAREHGNYLIPHVILAEFLSLTDHRHGSRTARRAQSEIRADSAFQVAQEADVDHVDELYRDRPTLSYADCVAASLAIRLQEPILTFDEKQRRAVRDPSAGAMERAS
jgi:predicted nucleic acid-binding protein